MPTDHETAARVGVRIVVVAAVVGFVVLVLSGAAHAKEPSVELQEWERVLLEREPLSAEERVERAESILWRDRNRRLARVHHRVLSTAWRVVRGASPLRILRGGYRLVGDVFGLRERPAAQDVALSWLEPGLGTDADAQLRDLYENLQGRERSALAESRLDAAETAMEAGQFEFARVLLKRSLDLQPDSEPALERFAELAVLEDAQRNAQVELSFNEWEVSVAEALLAKDYRGALEMGPPSSEAQFARAAAQLLSGERSAALDAFAEIESEGGELGSLASQWLERPDVDAERELARAIREFRIRQVLGWIGGSALADGGPWLSRDGLRAWRDSLTPVNIALSLPARIWSGWQPDGDELRGAAERYLAQEPEGPDAERARAWLESLGDRDQRGRAFGIGGALRLPAARTPFARLSVGPVVVARRALQSEFVDFSAPLDEALHGASALWLKPVEPQDLDLEFGLDGAVALAGDEARAVLDQLAFALEQRHFTGSSSRTSSLERVRRIDAAIQSGWVLVVEPWDPPQEALWDSFVSTFVHGREEQVGALSLERQRDRLVATRKVGESLSDCPREVLCIDRRPLLDGQFYGTLSMPSTSTGQGVGVDSEMSMGFGFQSRLGSAGGFSLGFSPQDGPGAELELPLGRWLGVSRWIPIWARISFGADDFYVGPVLRRADR